MGSAFDIVIIGAGIVGAACAAECTAAGLRVCVIERDVIGSGATAAGMGHIVVMDDSEEQFALTRYSQQLWRELRAQLPADVEYTDSGTIWVAADEEEMQEVYRKREFYGARGVPTEALDGRALAEAEPNLRPGLAGGLLVPEDGVVYPPTAARFLMESAQKAGAQLIMGKSVSEILKDGVRLMDGTEIHAGAVVNAGGALSPKLMPDVAVKTRKGHLVITDRYPNFVRHQLVELGYLKSAHSVSSDSVAFNAQPRATGQVLIGSSRQFGAQDGQVDHHMLTKMLNRACEYMPSLAKLSVIRSWTGFRPATPDNLPFIGPVAERPGLYLATGHEGLGITTSLATAKLLVDQIVGRPSAIPVNSYLPSRSVRESMHA